MTFFFCVFCFVRTVRFLLLFRRSRSIGFRRSSLSGRVIGHDAFDDDLSDNEAGSNEGQRSAWANFGAVVVRQLGAAEFSTIDSEADDPVQDAGDECSDEEAVVDKLEGADGQVNDGLDEADDGEDEPETDQEGAQDREGLTSLGGHPDVLAVALLVVDANTGAGSVVTGFEESRVSGALDKERHSSRHGEEESRNETDNQSDNVLDSHCFRRKNTNGSWWVLFM